MERIRKQYIREAIETAIAHGLKFMAQWHVSIDCHYIHSNDHQKAIAVETVIFNHEFAKALWGTHLFCPWMPLPGERVYILTAEEVSAGITSRQKPFGKDTFIYDTKDYKQDIKLYPNRYKPVWQYQLQQMVIADDPVVYLYDSRPSDIRIGK